MSNAELKITLFLVRMTIGWQSEETVVTYDEIKEGTGLSRRSIAKGINEVLQRGFFIKNGGQSKYRIVQKVNSNSAKSKLYDPLNSAKSKPQIVQKVNSNSAKSKPPSIYKEKERNTKENESQVEPILELCAIFSAEAGRRLLPNLEEAKKISLWFNPLIDIYRACNRDFKKTADVIADAVIDMQSRNFTPSTPYAVAPLAVKLAKFGAGQSSSQNGATPAFDPNKSLQSQNMPTNGAF